MTTHIAHQHQSPIDIEHFFDALARSTRSHVPARDALILHAHLLPNTPLWNRFIQQLHEQETLSSIFEHLRTARDHDAGLLVLAYNFDNFNPHALEHAAHIMRTRRHVEQSLTAGSAQARLTVRILTVLPCAVLTVGIATSRSLQRAITSPALLCVLFAGLLFNRCGAWWISRITSRVLRSDNLPQSVALVDALCVALHSGHSVTDACLSWEFINPCGARISQALRNGASLFDALHELSVSNVQFDSLVAQTLKSAHLDGLPIRNTATALAAEARKTYQSLIDARIQQLTTRTSLPLVLCVLPSFALLVLAPLVIANISQFSSALPSHIS